MASKQSNTVLAGPHAVQEALESGRSLDKAFVQQTEKQRLKPLTQALKEQGVPVAYVPRERLDRMTRTTHQGVIARTAPIQLFQLENWLPGLLQQRSRPTVALLDGITDVRNLGAIARSALSLGCSGLVVQQGHAASINEEAVKASAGALMHIPVCRENNLVDAAFMLQAEGFTLAACTEHAQTSWEHVPVDAPLAAIFGAEGRGIQPKLLRAAPFKGRLPIGGPVGSLNVSVAAGIAFYVIDQKRRN